MRNIQIYIIGVLIIIILAMLFLKGNKEEIKNIETSAKEKEVPHLAELIELRKHKIVLQHKLQTDSTAAHKAKITYESTISSLKKKLAAAKFTGKPADVPDDSVQLAMDCIEKQPIRDSIDSVNYSRISQLEKEKSELVKDYEKIMDDNQSEKNELQAIIDLKDKEIGELVKQARKANRKAKLRILEGVGLGVIGDLAIGGLH